VSYNYHDDPVNYHDDPVEETSVRRILPKSTFENTATGVGTYYLNSVKVAGIPAYRATLLKIYSGLIAQESVAPGK